MKHFDWTQFKKRVFINADLKSVYNAWTKKEELEKWFLSKAQFFNQNGKEILSTQNISSHCQYQWRWYAQNHYEEGTIMHVNGVDSIEFTFAGNCIVKIQLSSVNQFTLVELTQSNIPINESSKEDIRLGCAFGWTFYLINSKSILEGGLDLRNKDRKLKNVVNN